MPYMAINLGGVALGVGIILLVVMRWTMREKHRLGAIVPFVLSLLYGMLAALAALGSVSALGGITWIALWAGNVAGYAGLVWGIGGTAPDVTRAQQLKKQLYGGATAADQNQAANEMQQMAITALQEIQRR